jgi:uncharacterized RDD family membrane protein YckC
MSERGGLTPGDPLGGNAPAPSGGLWTPGDAPAPGYTTAPPPGAGGPAPIHGAPLAGRPALASWGQRAGAHLIDGLIVAVGAAILFVGITAPFSLAFFGGDDVGVISLIVGALLALLCAAVVALLYAPALMARTNGKTLGRQVTGCRVIRADGRPITFGFAMLREVLVKTLLVGVVSGATGGIGWLLDVLWPLWDEENRALHDFVVNTRTIRD